MAQPQLPYMPPSNKVHNFDETATDMNTTTTPSKLQGPDTAEIFVENEAPKINNT